MGLPGTPEPVLPGPVEHDKDIGGNEENQDNEDNEDNENEKKQEIHSPQS